MPAFQLSVGPNDENRTPAMRSKELPQCDGHIDGYSPFKTLPMKTPDRSLGGTSLKSALRNSSMASDYSNYSACAVHGWDSRNDISNRSAFSVRHENTPTSATNNASPFSNRSAWSSSTPKRATTLASMSTMEQPSPMSVEGDASTYATTASCQASPFVTFFGIQEDGLETYRHDATAADTTVDSAAAASSPLRVSALNPAAAATLGPLLRWERPAAAAAALGACVALFVVTGVLGRTLIGVVLDLLLAAAAASALQRLFAAAPDRPGAGARFFAAARDAVPAVLA